MTHTELSRRILIVDASLDAAEMLKELLQMAGYDARMALDGESGMDEAARFRPHVVCSGLDMPLLSGFEFARELRKTDHSRGALLIAITGWGDSETARLMKESGFDTHFLKPLQFSAFLSHLDDHFSRGAFE